MLSKIKASLRDFYPYAQKQLGFNRPVRLFIRQDNKNAQDVLGKTAHYDPSNDQIVIYITNRHPKDILRSFAHELVHHAQNCEGRLGGLTTEPGYDQKDQGMELEKEAYLGSMMVRNWEDGQKSRSNVMNEQEMKDLIGEVINESKNKKEEKQIIDSKTPTPKPQNNDDWYWGSLFNKLKNKWTK